LVTCEKEMTRLTLPEEILNKLKAPKGANHKLFKCLPTNMISKKGLFPLLTL